MKRTSRGDEQSAARESINRGYSRADFKGLIVPLIPKNATQVSRGKQQAGLVIRRCCCCCCCCWLKCLLVDNKTALRSKPWWGHFRLRPPPHPTASSGAAQMGQCSSNEGINKKSGSRNETSGKIEHWLTPFHLRLLTVKPARETLNPRKKKIPQRCGREGGREGARAKEGETTKEGREGWTRMESCL